MQLIVVPELNEFGGDEGMRVLDELSLHFDACKDAVVEVAERAVEVRVSAVAVRRKVATHLVEQRAGRQVGHQAPQSSDEGHVCVVFFQPSSLKEEFLRLYAVVAACINKVVHGVAEVELVELRVR